METTLKSICSMQADNPMTAPRYPILYTTHFIFLHSPLLTRLVVALQKFNKRCSIVRMPIISQVPPPPFRCIPFATPPLPHTQTPHCRRPHPLFSSFSLSLSASLSLVMRRQFEKHCQCIFCLPLSSLSLS